MTSAGAASDEVRYPARSRSEAALRKPSNELESWASQEEDLELVIQKHENAFMANQRQAPCVGDVYGEYAEEDVEAMARRSRTIPISIRTSDLSGFGPFEPRLDRSTRCGSWFSPSVSRSALSERLGGEEV